MNVLTSTQKPRNKAMKNFRIPTKDKNSKSSKNTSMPICRTTPHIKMANGGPTCYVDKCSH